MKNTKCLLGLHKWKGCSCVKCHKKRDKNHRWNGCKCSLCGKIRDEEHDWSRDCQECTICGKKRDDGHSWESCACTKCESSRHDWEEKGSHVWGRITLCVCRSCSAINIDKYIKTINEAQNRLGFGSKSFGDALKYACTVSVYPGPYLPGERSAAEEFCKLCCLLVDSITETKYFDVIYGYRSAVEALVQRQSPYFSEAIVIVASRFQDMCYTLSKYQKEQC